MRVVTTVAELDEELAAVARAGAVSDAARRAQFETFAMRLPADFPPDADGAPYRQRQLDLYAHIAGRPYSVANERTLFDVESMADKPFPFLNEGWAVTGDQLIAIGWLFKAMKLPPKASILEFGPGWGNTTLALAQNGHAVTAIEIEPNFIALIAERARRLNLKPLDLVQGDFLDAAHLGRTFDAVLFFESFHHCADHQRLFDLLPSLLNQGGVAVFGAEPIDETFPYPWSLRLDGQSLWAIRANGWLELGFTESYFIASLMRRGFVVEKLQSSASPLASCLVARQADGHYVLGTFTMAPSESRTWAEAETDPTVLHRFSGAQSRLTLRSGGSFAAIRLALRNYAPFSLPVAVTFGAASAQQIVEPHATATLTLPYDPAGTTLELRTNTWRPADHPGMGADRRSLGIAVQTIDLIP